MQVYVASQWMQPFSWTFNTISDLGNTACAIYNGRFVCSPACFLMNVSFVFLGLCQLVGAIILYATSPRSRLEQVGFSAMALAGIGTLLVGVFPENTIAVAHGAAAALPLVVGNIGLVMFGFSRWLPSALRWYSRIFGVLALVAITLFVTGHTFGIGQGTMERIAAYPQTIWLMAVGCMLLFRDAQIVRYNRTHHGRKQHNS